MRWLRRNILFAFSCCFFNILKIFFLIFNSTILFVCLFWSYFCYRSHNRHLICFVCSMKNYVCWKCVCSRKFPQKRWVAGFFVFSRLLVKKFQFRFSVLIHSQTKIIQSPKSCQIIQIYGYWAIERNSFH